MTSILQDKIFISTRPKHESDDLPEILAAEGATVIEFPLIQIKNAEITDDEKNILKNTGRFNWIVLTSPNGVRHFFNLLKEITGSHHIPDSVNIAVIGPKTEKELLSFGYHAGYVNPGSTAEDFASPFLKHIKQNRNKPHILLPLSNLARTVIQDELKDAADCVRINIYQTVFPDHFDNDVLKRIQDGRYDMMIFTSPSGIRNLLTLVPSIQKNTVRMACIGEVTRREAMKQGFLPLATAAKSSAAGLVESIINYYISKK